MTKLTLSGKSDVRKRVARNPKHGKGKPSKRSSNVKSVPVSKKIRDVKRLLNKVGLHKFRANVHTNATKSHVSDDMGGSCMNLQPDLGAVVRTAVEKRLAELLEEFAERKKAAVERKYAVRYHKIRFFERVKLERRLAKLKRMAVLSPEQQRERTHIEENLQYVLHFPRGEKYVSILKNADEPEAQEHLEAERERLRGLIRRQLAEAALVAEPDEGRALAAAFQAEIKNPTQNSTTMKPSLPGSKNVAPLPELEHVADVTDDFFLAGDVEVESDGDREFSPEDDTIALEEDDYVDQGTRDSIDKRPIEAGSAKSTDQRPAVSDEPGLKSQLATKRQSARANNDKGFVVQKKCEVPGRSHAAASRGGGPVRLRESKVKSKRTENVRRTDHRPSSMVEKKAPNNGTPGRTRAEGGRKRRKKNT